MKVGDRAYFRELRGGRPWTVSNLLTDRVTGAPIFIIASRIDDQKGSLVGVVVAVAEVGDLGERAVELYHPVGEAIALFDRDGVLVYNSQKTAGPLSRLATRGPAAGRGPQERHATIGSHHACARRQGEREVYRRPRPHSRHRLGGRRPPPGGQGDGRASTPVCGSPAA